MAARSLLVLVLALVVALLGSAAAQSTSGLTGVIGAAACFADSDNRAAAQQIATDCSDLASSITTSGTNVDFNCPSACGDAFNELTQSCRNEVASSDTLGSSYRLIFDACNVNYAATGGGPSTPAPTSSSTAATTAPSGAGAIDGSDFLCLTTSENIDAGQDFTRYCSGLMPQADSSSDSGISIDCPAQCESALQDVSSDCINTIASSDTFGAVYRLIFDACNVDYDASSSNSTDSPASAPSNVEEPPSASVPVFSPIESPSDAGASPTTSAPTAAPTPVIVPISADGPTPAPTASAVANADATDPAPAPQAASRTASAVAPVGALVALCAALLTLVA
jgi:predicted RNA-binding Zn-ribbon protein involved in translation (DUF1610 family)